MKAVIYLVGGGNSKDLHIRCRRGFRELLESSGFRGNMPRLVSCGGRRSAYDDFKTGHVGQRAQYVAMLVDSEELVTDPEKTWDHLKEHDGWDRPGGADDEQVLFMTTCMETWIVTDRDTLRKHYGSNLQESALPPLVDPEQRQRHDIQDQLIRATRNCQNAYAKGKRSFEVLGKLSPQALRAANLSSFQRMEKILSEKLL